MSQFYGDDDIESLLSQASGDPKSPTQKRIDECHAEIRKAFDKCGLVDGFYVGIGIDGIAVQAYACGVRERISMDNRERFDRLLGVIEQLKLDFQMNAFKNQKN